jgi:hypothetical protein
MPPEREPEYDQYGVRIPENSRSRIAGIMRSHPRTVDHNGFEIRGPDPSVTVIVGEPGKSPKMVDAIMAAAESLDLDPASVVASEDFRRTIASINPADTDAVVAAVADAAGVTPPAATPPAPGMKPNPAQGSSSLAGPPKAPQNTNERIHDLSSALLAR